MNLRSRKSGVITSRFYALVFVTLTGILGMVSPLNLTLMVAQAQTTQDRQAEAERLFNQGKQFTKSEQFKKAIDSFHRSLAIYRQLGNTKVEPVLLYLIGGNYLLLQDLQKARESLLKCIELAKKIGSHEAEAQATDLLNRISQSLPESTNQNRKAEADRLFKQGLQQYQTSQFEAALQSWQQALNIYQEIKDRKGESETLGNLGVAYQDLGNYDRAINFQLQRLAIARQLKDRLGEAQSMGNLGFAYDALEKYDKAIEIYLQVLEIAREIKNRWYEARILANLGADFSSLGKYDKAIDFHLQSLAIARELKDQNIERDALRNLGNDYKSLGKYYQAIEIYLQSIAISRGVRDRRGEAKDLTNLGNIYHALGKYDKAIEFHLQSLEIDREIKDRRGEATSLRNLGISNYSLGKYDKAVDSLQQSLTIFRQLGNSKAEADLLYMIGANYALLSDFQKGQELLRQSIELAKKTRDRETEARASNLLNKISQSLPTTTNQNRKAEADGLLDQGKQQFQISQFEQAFQSWQQALTIYREIKDRRGEGNALGNLGSAYQVLGKFDKVIDLHLQSIEIAREIKDRRGEGRSLGNLGVAYAALGKYDKMIEYSQQSLVIAREIKDRLFEGTALGSIGSAYYYLSKYDKALEYHLQSLVIAREIKDRRGEGQLMGSLGLTYAALGKYDKAIEFQLQRLAIAREIKDRLGEGNALGNLGSAYGVIGKYDKAIEFQLQRLAIAREIKDRRGEAQSLGNLGIAYQAIGKYDKAIEFYLQDLAIGREIKDRNGEGQSLGVLGLAYLSLRKYDKAIDSQLQSLAITREIKDRSGEGISFNNLGATFNQFNQPELAILFYKQAVNVTEEIRKDINKLDKDIQKSYLNKIEVSYRQLADLLLKQGRIMEALQVLDLLKVQELQDFFKDVQGNEKTAQGIELLNEEKEYWQSFNKQKIDLTTANTPPILQQLRQTAPAQNIKLAAYKDLQTRLQKLGSNSALLYPLILEDRLELVLFVPNAPPINRTVKVTQTELIKVAEQFREDIQKPNSLAVLDPANKLYNWMIEPIANDLKQANITTIIYAPDGVMRHVPLAALYDGKRWLVEKYRINYITALSLTNIDPQTQQAPRILAGAFTDRSGTVKIGDNNISFSSLPAALPEVENLVANFPNTTKLIDKDFNRKAIESNNLNQYNIIHFATHAHLVAGSPEDSFVLLNNNEYVTLRQVKDWKLPNVGLAVFSACQTALGGKLSSGIEIIGFGYQLQQAQARASIATLWEISDGGTQALMGKFYEKMKLTSSSAEALQQAQIDLIRSNGKSTDEKRAGVRITWRGIKPEVESQLNHPYYWAPFILIGNGF